MSENSIKPATFRLNEEDINKFKEFATENNLNQQEAFTSLLNTLELNNAKNNLGKRANSIESFQITVNSLVKFYINSLEENTTTEDRIREELSKELQTKDNTINTMYDQLQKSKEEKSEMEKVVKENSINLEKANEAILDWVDKNDKLKKDSEDKQKSIDVLTRNNLNQMQQLEEYRDLKSTNDLLLEQLEAFKSKNLSLDNTNAQLEDKLSNSKDMISFYKDNVSDLKESVDQYKSEIKELEAKHDKHIEEIKAEYERSLEKEKGNSEHYRLELEKLDDKYQKQIKEIKVEYENAAKKEIESIKEQLNNKYSIDLGKKDLENERLKNEIEKLNAEAKNTNDTDNANKTNKTNEDTK